MFAWHAEMALSKWFLPFLVSFSFDWEDISNTQDNVQILPHFQACWHLGKNILLCIVFVTLFLVKHGLSGLIYFIVIWWFAKSDYLVMTVWCFCEKLFHVFVHNCKSVDWSVNMMFLCFIWYIPVIGWQSCQLCLGSCQNQELLPELQVITLIPLLEL